jgi:hypothetical protein
MIAIVAKMNPSHWWNWWTFYIVGDMINRHDEKNQRWQETGYMMNLSIIGNMIINDIEKSVTRRIRAAIRKAAMMYPFETVDPRVDATKYQNQRDD